MTCSTSSTTPTRWPAKDPRVPVVVEFDFSRLGGAVSDVVIGVSAYSQFGIDDAAPAGILSGAAFVDGAVVRQTIADGVEMVDYYLTCQANVSGYGQAIFAAVLPVRLVAALP